MDAKTSGNLGRYLNVSYNNNPSTSFILTKIILELGP